MKLQIVTISAFICAVAATAVPNRLHFDSSPIRRTSEVEVRQTVTDEENELEDDACRDVTFIFARGSTEPGNMGVIIGQQVCSGLKQTLGEDTVACQGVGPPYDATIEDNFLPQNTSPADIGAATTLFDLANSKCPNTKVLAGGYSQGTAVMDGSIQALPANIQSQIAAVVLFGFTRNEQDDGRIPNYPPTQTEVFCAVGDLVCNGTLTITAAHLSYGTDAPAAVSFLVSKL